MRKEWEYRTEKKRFSELGIRKTKELPCSSRPELGALDGGDVEGKSGEVLRSGVELLFTFWC